MSPQMRAQGRNMLFAISIILDVLSVILPLLPCRWQFLKNQKEQTKNGEIVECQEAELNLCRLYFLWGTAYFPGKDCGCVVLDITLLAGAPCSTGAGSQRRATTAGGEEQGGTLALADLCPMGSSSLGSSTNDSMCASRVAEF